MVFLKLDPHCRHFPVASPLRPLKNKLNILNSLTVTVNFDTTLIFLLFHIVLTIILLITRSCALLHGLFFKKKTSLGNMTDRCSTALCLTVMMTVLTCNRLLLFFFLCSWYLQISPTIEKKVCMCVTQLGLFYL